GGSRSMEIGLVAGRLSEAMLLTAFGLLVSIVAFTFYRHLSVRMETFDREMEHAAGELVSHLVVHFGPLRKAAPRANAPERSVDSPVASPRLSITRMFRHGALELVWPRLTSELDADSVLESGMWVSFTYGFLAWLNCYWDRRPHAGIVVFAFLVV